MISRARTSNSSIVIGFRSASIANGRYGALGAAATVPSLPNDALRAPPLGHALELVLPGILEHEARSRDEVLYGLGDEDLRGRREGADPRADDDPQAAGLAVDRGDLSGVDARSDLQAEGADRLDDRLGASDGSRGVVHGHDD